MEKYLVTIEYRYNDAPDSFDRCYRNKIDTVGVFENIKEAIIEGNKILIDLEKIFNLNKYHNKKYRLSNSKMLISNLAYLETPFDFYLKIETLYYKNSLDDVLKSINNYDEYKKTLE